MSLKNIIYELLIRKKIGVLKKKKFALFGVNSVIEKPYLQLSGLNGISIGDDVTILKNCRFAVYGNITKPSIIVGNRCYIGFGFTALSTANSKIEIGNDVLFASNVLITSENHGINPEIETPYMNQPLLCKPVNIGDGTWIGEKVSILSGVNIGKKCVIGTNAVVTKDIPDYSIAVGIPAKVVKKYNFDSHDWELV